MKFGRLLAIAFGTYGVAHGEVAQTSPLSKVLELLGDLQDKVTKEGEAEQKSYRKYYEWCDDAAKSSEFAIKASTKLDAKLDAAIAKLSSDIQVATSKIDDAAKAIATSDKELHDAGLIREKEASDYVAAEKELIEIVDALERASAIIEKQSTGNPALAQVDFSRSGGTLEAISTLLDAAAFPSADKNKLSALLQSPTSSNDDIDPFNPTAAPYKSHGGGILEVLEDMREKSETQLSNLRKAEVNAKHNYEMLKQSLEKLLSVGQKEMADHKASAAEAEERKATAAGELQVNVKDLASSKEELASVQAGCMQTAADHDASLVSRSEELKAIAEAIKILQESTSGAASQTYSFLQTSSSKKASRRTAPRITSMVKQLARQHHSAALAQLASRVAAAFRFGSLGGNDPFSKVKGLVSDMIAKLEKEMGEEATEKAYCDEQMSKTEEKKEELEAAVAKMNTKIDTETARAAELKEQIRGLQKELSALTKEQAQLDSVRQEEHANYETAKADLELGLNGVRKALGVLREYYGGAAEEAAFLQDGGSMRSAMQMQQPAAPQSHAKAGGAGSSIIGVLEVIESDFATSLAKEETEEDNAQDEYEKVTQETRVDKASKEQGVKYKGQEAVILDQSVSERSSDLDTTQSELSAVLEYYSKIKSRCIVKPESYESRKQKRESEIQGLKDALEILESETAPALVQKRTRTSFRGVLRADA